jgi:HSP20 family protein
MALPTLRRGNAPMRVNRGQEHDQSGTLGRFDPWSDYNTMGRLFEPFFASPWAAMGRGMGRTAEAEPTIELYETTDDLIAFVTAPGLNRESLEITTTPDSVTIKGERRPQLEVSDDLTSHTPWGGIATSTSTFDVTYNLPLDVNPDAVQANYRDGILELRMPKSEAAKPKKVRVDVQHT